MIEKKRFFPKYYSRTTLNTSKLGCFIHFLELRRFLLPFQLKYQILETEPQKHTIKIQNIHEQ